ncbi:MAG: hypothetical protein ACI90V_006313 [Bacillariaceae sp.]|jgi:hypothetical protein
MVVDYGGGVDAIYIRDDTALDPDLDAIYIRDDIALDPNAYGDGDADTDMDTADVGN